MSGMRNIKTSLLKIRWNKHITLISDANVPVRFRAQQRAKYSLLLLKANCIAAQTDLRITEHKGHKFSPSHYRSFQNSNRMVTIASFPNSCNFQGNIQVFRLTGLLWWQKLTWIIQQFNFFSIYRFRSSCLVSLQVFIPREATLNSSLTVAWFSWTNHNHLLRIATNGIASFCIDHRWRQMAFFVFVKMGEGPTFARLTWNKAAFMRAKFNSLSYKTNRFHVAVHLCICASVHLISDTLGYRLVCHFFVLTTFWRHLWSITGPMHGNMESIC